MGERKQETDRVRATIQGHTTRKIITLTILLALAGCMSDARRCAGYGFTPGTSAYAQCQENLYMSRFGARPTTVFVY